MSNAGKVKLDLQDGFVGDEVVVSVDGREVLRTGEVTTRPQIGLARSISLPVGPGTAALSVAVPALGLTATTELPATRPLRVAASLNATRDQLELRLLTERFGYA